jgi:hypothetical protein
MIFKKYFMLKQRSRGTEAEKEMAAVFDCTFLAFFRSEFDDQIHGTDFSASKQCLPCQNPLLYRSSLSLFVREEE